MIYSSIVNWNDFLAKKFTDDELLDILVGFSRRHGCTPTADDFRPPSSPSVKLFYSRFGSWKNAIEQAGLEKKKIDSANMKQYTNEELICKLVTFFDEHGRPPVARDLKKYRLPSHGTYIDRFGSFKNALEEAGLLGLRTDLHLFGRKHYSDSEMEMLLSDWIKNNKKLPTAREIDDDKSLPHSSLYISRFGGINHVFKKLGFEIENRHTVKSNEELLSDLAALYEKNGHAPSARELAECTECAGYNVYNERFGSIYNAYELCGIPHVKRIKFLTDKQIVEHWYTLKDRLRRIPTIQDIEDSETNIYLAFTTNSKRWKSYTEFLHSIGESQNYNKYGCKVFFTTKGTKCFSKYEYKITQWFEDNHLNFQKEVPYREVILGDATNRKFDWAVKSCKDTYYIEMFGITNNETYDIKTDKKIEDCKNNGINLISLFPEDISRNSLDEIFHFLKTS